MFSGRLSLRSPLHRISVLALTRPTSAGGLGGRNAEPFQEWVLTARNACEIAVSGSLQEKRVLAQKVFGSNLVLDCKIARGSCVKPWSALVESNQTGGLERVKGIESLILLPDYA